MIVYYNNYNTGFASKLNNYVFPGSGQMKNTADNADAGFQPAQHVAVSPSAKPALQPFLSCQN